MKRFDTKKFIKNKYNHLLTTLTLLFILSPSMEVRDKIVQFPIFPFIIMVVLVTAVKIQLGRGKLFHAFLIFSFIDFALYLVIYFIPESSLQMIHVLKLIARGISAMLFFVTIYHLSRQLFRVQEVTTDTIKGGISAYLLLGFVWAILYGLLVQIYPNAFTIASHKEMMYVHFSFTTLTTLGYGDIVPNGRFAAVLTNLEAIVGQLYLTIFVARLVGLYIVREQKNQSQG